MRFACRVAIAVLALGIGLSFPVRAAEKSLCLVCKVKSGESNEEEAKAWRTYEGERYGFCSEKCAREFDAEPAAYVPPVFPRPAPELSLVDLAGKSVSWEAFKDKVVLVDFWATWCTPCRKSMPQLQALYDRHGARGFTVLGVSIDQPKDTTKVRKFVSSKKITYPIAIDSQRSPAWESYRVKAVPAAFLVDQKGRIVAQWTGVAADTREIEGKLQDLLPHAD